MTPNSFSIGSSAINSYDAWGIKVVGHDVFSPPKRDRRLQIPFRHGSYIQNSDKYYDDRHLRIECQLTRRLSKAEFREVIYILSQRSAIFLWDEPDKYYLGELYESVEVTVFPKECGRSFILPFVCEPFAYGPQQTIKLKQGLNAINYAGTAESPTLLVIRNPNNVAAKNIVVTAIQKIKT
jgi:phage-related protein